MIFEQGDELINFEATFSAISILDTYDNNSIYKYIIETNIPKKKVIHIFYIYICIYIYIYIEEAVNNI